jgi:hypothetical protein
MANEIYAKYSSGFDLDGYVFRKTDDKVCIPASGAFETWNDVNVLTYDIPMTDRGDGYYSAGFPATITTEGVYRVIIKLRTGVEAEVGNTGLFQGELSWDGTEEIDLFTIDNSISTLTVSQSRVLNVYGVDE